MFTGDQVNDRRWSAAAGKAERLLLGIPNRALNGDKRSTPVGGSWDKAAAGGHGHK
jgi:hypothetical protein